MTRMQCRRHSSGSRAGRQSAAAATPRRRQGSHIGRKVREIVIIREGGGRSRPRQRQTSFWYVAKRWRLFSIGAGRGRHRTIHGKGRRRSVARRGSRKLHGMDGPGLRMCQTGREHVHPHRLQRRPLTKARAIGVLKHGWRESKRQMRPLRRHRPAAPRRLLQGRSAGQEPMTTVQVLAARLPQASPGRFARGTVQRQHRCRAGDSTAGKVGWPT